ncbi:MAG: hypothetical protein ACJAZ3_000197 [Sphingobacteriales bacterium]|jgi:hypothetical protein
MKNCTLFILLLLSIFSNLSSQNVAVGNWQTYMPYSNAIDVTFNNGKVYLAGENGLFYYDTRDNSINILSTVSGLSDVEINVIKANSPKKFVLVGYGNGNIDLIDIDDKVINIPDIKRSTIVGSKKINFAQYEGDSVYISSDFGIVLINTSTLEVLDTYLIGNKGANVKVFGTARIDDTLFAASENGIYKASLVGDNLSNYQNWVLLDSTNGIPTGSCELIAGFSNRIFAMIGDSIYQFQNSQWTNTNFATEGLNDFRVDGRFFIQSFYFKVRIFDENMTPFADREFGDFGFPGIQGAFFAEDGSTWAAVKNAGLVRQNSGKVEVILPEGPTSVSSRRLDVENNQLIVAPGSTGSNFEPLFNKDGFFKYEDGNWDNFNRSTISAFDSVEDIVTVKFDPFSDKIYMGSIGDGLIEFENGQVKNVFKASNSSLEESSVNNVRVISLDFDSQGDLWVLNDGVSAIANRLDRDGNWKAFNFSGVLSGGAVKASEILVDRFDQKWVIIRNGGILVFKEDENDAITARFFNSSFGVNEIELDRYFSIEEDLDGRIWVGSAEGIRVFFNPADALSSNPSEAQPIRIVQDGLVQFLLESDQVLAIKADGANRKWVGTTNGAWLFSPDGTEVISYFNEENSPLINNNVNDIEIMGKTGEVFFATDKGIVSYRGTATTGLENHENVKVFPNPVRPEYEGLISVNGLAQNAEVKITDIAGNLVFQTNANGGQATWNGKNNNGERVGTGVYLVFSSSSDGIETFATKVLFIN